MESNILSRMADITHLRLLKWCKVKAKVKAKVKVKAEIKVKIKVAFKV